MPAIAILPAHGGNAFYKPTVFTPRVDNQTSVTLSSQATPTVTPEAAAAAVETTSVTNIAAVHAQLVAVICNVYSPSFQPSFCQPDAQAAFGPDVSTEWLESYEASQNLHENEVDGHANVVALPHIDADERTRTRVYRLAFYVGQYVLQKHDTTSHPSQAEPDILPPMPLEALLEPFLYLFAATGKPLPCPNSAVNQTQVMLYIADFEATAASMSARLNDSSITSNPPSTHSRTNTSAPLRSRSDSDSDSDSPPHPFTIFWPFRTGSGSHKRAVSSSTSESDSPPHPFTIFWPFRTGSGSHKRAAHSASDSQTSAEPEFSVEPHVHFHFGRLSSEDKMSVIRLGFDTLREFIESMRRGQGEHTTSSSSKTETPSSDTKFGSGVRNSTEREGENGRQVKKVEVEVEMEFEKRSIFKDLLAEFVSEWNGERDEVDRCKMLGLQGDYDLPKWAVGKMLDLDN